MKITGFKDMYITELQEMTSFEGQLGEALRRMAKVASHPSLKKALLHQQEQTQADSDHAAPGGACARPQIDDMIGGADH
jgi:ferritin-like metal-binding protein YciE